MYIGESGYSAYTRLCEHRDSIRKRDVKNALAKHLSEEHPEDEGEAGSFKFEVVKTFKKPIERQVTEAVAIYGCQAATILNSKSEWEQPAVERIVVTRELPDRELVGRQDRGSGGGGGRGRAPL